MRITTINDLGYYYEILDKTGDINEVLFDTDGFQKELVRFIEDFRFYYKDINKNLQGSIDVSLARQIIDLQEAFYSVYKEFHSVKSIPDEIEKKLRIYVHIQDGSVAEQIRKGWDALMEGLSSKEKIVVVSILVGGGIIWSLGKEYIGSNERIEVQQIQADIEKGRISSNERLENSRIQADIEKGRISSNERIQSQEIDAKEKETILHHDEKFMERAISGIENIQKESNAQNRHSIKEIKNAYLKPVKDNPNYSIEIKIEGDNNQISLGEIDNQQAKEILKSERHKAEIYNLTENFNILNIGHNIKIQKYQLRISSLNNDISNKVVDIDLTKDEFNKVSEALRTQSYIKLKLQIKKTVSKGLEIISLEIAKDS